MNNWPTTNLTEKEIDGDDEVFIGPMAIFNKIPSKDTFIEKSVRWCTSN